MFIYDAKGQLIAEHSTQLSQQPQTSYLTSDHLGSPRINTNALGQVISRHDYQPFGEEIARSVYGADTNRKQFTGYERDKETDLDFAQARYHSSNLGRFTSPDPYKIVAEIQVEPDESKAKTKLNNYLFIPQKWNQYIYTVNNPLKYIDPSGEEIYIVADSEKEREKLLKRIEKLLGEDRSRLVVTEYKNDKKLGAVIVLSFLNGRKELQFGNLGNGDEKRFSAIMSQIIGSNEIVEFRSGTSYKTNSGKIISLKSEGGGSTIGAADSETGNVQVWVHPTESSYLAYLNSRTPMGAGKSNTDQELDFNDEQVDGHEFGHAYAGLNGGDVNSESSLKISVEMENIVRARNPKNSQRRTRH